MEAIVNEKGRVVFINGAGRGGAFSPNARTIPIEDIPVDDYFDDDGNFTAKNLMLTDLPIARLAYNQRIDAETGRAIDAAIHPFVATEESIGVLRDQMVRWGNALGLEFTEDFTRMNKIAIAAIKEGAAKKGAL